MRKVTKYRRIVRKLLNEIANTGRYVHDEVQTTVVEDEKKGEYLLFTDGWTSYDRRVYGCYLHVSVKDNGHVYLNYDGTDLEVGKKLLERGVLPEDLVPAFQPPEVREEMGFAVA